MQLGNAEALRDWAGEGHYSLLVLLQRVEIQGVPTGVSTPVPAHLELALQDQVLPSVHAPAGEHEAAEDLGIWSS